MTGVTLLRGTDVGRRFTRGTGAVMTALTNALGLVVINRGDRHPGYVVVAGLAHPTGENVCGSLARGTSAIVTDNAGFRRGAMIKHRHHPAGCDVTAIASQAGRDVINACSGGDRPIMTTLAGAGDLRMIHQRIDRRPGGAGVTRLTNTGGGNVCRPATGGNHTIVAGITTADHLRVIHQWIDRRPGRVDMTGLAQIRGIDMRR